MSDQLNCVLWAALIMATYYYAKLKMTNKQLEERLQWMQRWRKRLSKRQKETEIPLRDLAKYLFENFSSVAAQAASDDRHPCHAAQGIIIGQHTIIKMQNQKVLQQSVELQEDNGILALALEMARMWDDNDKLIDERYYKLRDDLHARVRELHEKRSGEPVAAGSPVGGNLQQQLGKIQ